ncbi:MAG: tetratricopeptide repeat protein [Planctomycetaceae bacterium]|jgi:tetratricopeptide (TPR) repeat protein|nr:tetratricopeptide repeat protein [Planctomycetaceae bacterium]
MMKFPIIQIPFAFLILSIFSVNGLFLQAFGQGGQLYSEVLPQNPDVFEGVQAAVRGDNTVADKYFAEAMEKKPGSRPGGVDAAMAFLDPSLELKFFDKSRFWLEKTAEDFPEDPEAFLLLADIALSESRYLECSMLSKHALGLAEKFSVNPQRQHSLQIYGEKLLADTAERRKNWNEAVRQLTKLHELEPENAEYLYRLGLVRFRLGQKDEAVQILSQAESQNNKLLPALILLAQLSEQLGNNDEAAQYLAKAIEKDGDNPRVLIAAADLELIWNHLDKVKMFAEKAHQLDPNSSDAVITLGIVDLYAGDYEKAEEKFTKITEVQPNNSEAMIGLALALCEQNDARQLRRAFTVAKRNADQNPYSIDAQTTLAWVLVQANSLNEAEKILMRYFNTNELNSLGAYYLAVIFSRQNRKDEAILFLKTSLAANINFPKRVAAEKLLKTLTE